MKKFVLSLIAFAAAAASLPAQETVYQVDGVHSYVFARAIHFGAGRNYVRFNKISGSVSFNEADASKSSVNIEIAADSLDSGNEKRDQHLKGPDFFNVKQFPTATFKSTKVEKKDDNTFNVTGDLTLHGKTKSVTTLFRIVGRGKSPQDGSPRLGGETMFTIKRTDFDMGFMVGPLSDEVEILVAIEGAPAKK